MKSCTILFTLSCCISATLYSSEEWNARIARINSQLETASAYNQAFKAGNRNNIDNVLNQANAQQIAGKKFKKERDGLLTSQKKQAEYCECNCLSSCSFFAAISNCFHGKCNTCWEKCCAHEREEKAINDATIN